MNTTAPHKIVSQEEWLRASQELLAKEKEFTHLRDELARRRLEHPWVKVDKEYTFDTVEGKKTLAELFGKNNQLIIYHFMFAPGWTEGCSGCSFVSDHIDAARQHFEHHEVAIVVVSRAPLAEFMAFKKRMGWTFDWVSSSESDFNYDFQASYRRADLDAGPVFYNFKEQTLKSEDQPGATSFYKDDDGAIYRTYSTYERGLDLLVGAYNWLDIAPLGRNEESGMEWMCLHDEYEN